MDNLNKKVVSATKWAAITQIVAKLVAPITNMVLARLLTPEAFGVVATLTMIITFAELFTDAGFQKYLVQKDFKDETDREQSTNVAFWSNFILSLIIWGIIAIFNEPLAALVGSPGLGIVLIVACFSIPLAAFSSIQMALYQRDLDFKTLFKVRLIGICVPLIVTIPLAFWLRSYWALVIGTIVQNVINAFFLSYYSKWKPHFQYSIQKLKEMFSFAAWSLIESVSVWLTGYIDIFVVGTMLNKYYLGLYNTSITIVGQIMGLIIAATTPVLFSGLSKLQNDDEEFKRVFFKFQKYVSIILIPLGFGIFCYKELLTAILLGDQWNEAEEFIGIWGMASAITIILSHYSSEVYRSKGQPRLSVIVQWLHLIVLVPVIFIAANYGFKSLYVFRTLARGELILVNLIVSYVVFKISIKRMFTNITPALIASLFMLLVSQLLRMVDSSMIWEIASLCICAVSYLCFICIFAEERNIIKDKVFHKIWKY